MNRGSFKRKFAWVVVFFQFSLCVSQLDSVSEMEATINKGIAESSQYQLPTNNEQYRPQNSFNTEEFGCWDFIIVGAGCGGAVVANRLSEVTHWKILLLEAGGPETNFSVIPAMQSYLQFSRLNWGYYTTKQKYSCLGMHENRCPILKGRALGGSSAINYGFYARGNRGDFDKWAREGNLGWTYHEILPYFIKSQNLQTQGDPGYHGRNGYWLVKNGRPLGQLFENFRDGTRMVQNFTSTDYNGRDEIGYFEIMVNNDGPYRDSANNAFLKPITNRSNLRIVTSAYVTKVIFGPGGKTARGVLFSKDGKQYCAKANMEVILSAGAINTPQILMLSGIGPRDHLKKMDIKVLRDLPVGRTLHDHSVFSAAYIGTNYTSLDQEDLRQQIKNFFNNYGILTKASDSQGVTFLRTKYSKVPTYPDLEMIVDKIKINSLSTFLLKNLRVTNETYSAITNSIRGYQSVLSVRTLATNSQSIGSVTLKCKDPYEFPNIDANFLADDCDIEIIYQGILIIQQILATEPMRKINAKLIEVDYPQCKMHQLGSKDYWYCAFRLTTSSIYHQCGTCRMGVKKKTSVVNSGGRVHGTKSLRIVDASIFPTLVAGHTAAPTVMIAEKVSDVIKLQYGVPIQPITNTIN